MQMDIKKDQRVVAAVPDLFFAAKIGETARQVGAKVEFVHSAGELHDKLQSTPSLVIVDLNAEGIDTVSIVSSLKSDPASAAVPLVGFVRHEMSELIEAARRAGCDEVLSRNAFSKQLGAILRGEGFSKDELADRKC